MIRFNAALPFRCPETVVSRVSFEILFNVIRMSEEFIQKARRFAELAHGLVLNSQGELGQRRKGTNEPYTKHLSEVAKLVAECGATKPKSQRPGFTT